MACLRAGFVFHPLNSSYQPNELEFFIGDAEPTVVVCSPEKLSIYESLAVNHVFTLAADASGSLAEQSANVQAEFGVVDSAAGDLAALLYSSGTTGVPKGIMLTHQNLVSNTESLVSAWEFSAADRLLHALPIFHVHGLFVAIGCVMMSGASMRWLEKFDARESLRYLGECSVMMGVPTYYTRLLAEAEFSQETCAGVRVFISGSAPLLPETFNEFEQRTGHRILERYGMTETNMNTSNPFDGERRIASVGFPLPGVDIKICNPQTGDELATGETGMIEVRGPNVFLGYWRKPEKTALELRDNGFFISGDLGKIDADGYVYIVGREKDLIISGGYNIYPKQIESEIDRLDGVLESAVFGVAHADLGEAVAAAVVPLAGAELDPEQLIHALAASLAKFKLPRKIFVIDELPRNAMGKVQKNSLRERYG